MVVDLSLVAVTYTSVFAPVFEKELLEIQPTIVSGFILDWVLDMIRAHSQIYCTDRCSQHSSII